jgi:serine/threonine protein phosphatase 1
MKTYAIGDLHGELQMLEAMLDRLPLTAEDTIVFLGDYIDRGPDASGVIDRILQLKEEGLNVIALKGNHEAMYLHYLRGEDVDGLFLNNGGPATIRSYRTLWNRSGYPPEAHLEFLESLPLCHTSENDFFVHAGARPCVALDSQTEEDLLWIRSDFLCATFDFGKRIIFGHTPHREPLVQPDKIGIDTGATYGGKLTCLCLPDEIFYSI